MEAPAVKEANSPLYLLQNVTFVVLQFIFIRKYLPERLEMQDLFTSFAQVEFVRALGANRHEHYNEYSRAVQGSTITLIQRVQQQ